MRQKFVLCASSIALGLALLAHAPRAHAEAGLCDAYEIVEVFAGTEHCPLAQYVVLKKNWPSTHVDAIIWAHDHCGRPLGTIGGTGSQTHSQGDRILLARPEAEALFGIAADETFEGVDASHAPLIPRHGSLRSSCGGDLYYGEGSLSSLPALVPGKALHRQSVAAWTLEEPSPVNSAGEVGQLGVCPGDIVIDAGGAGDAGDAGLDGGLDSGLPACSDPSDADVDDGSSGEGGTGGSFSDAPKDPDDADRADAGGSGGLQGVDASEDSSGAGCGCRTAPARSAGSVLLAALGVLFAARRRQR